MEPVSFPKSKSKFLQLTNIEDLNEYTNLLAKCYNNPHKYSMPSNDIQIDTFGDPYIIFQYFDIESLEETKKPKVSFFGQIILLRSDLDLFDRLTDDHHCGMIKMIFAQDFTTKDKINPLLYRLVLYMKANSGEAIDPKLAEAVTPTKIK